MPSVTVTTVACEPALSVSSSQSSRPMPWRRMSCAFSIAVRSLGYGLELVRVGAGGDDAREVDAVAADLLRQRRDLHGRRDDVELRCLRAACRVPTAARRRAVASCRRSPHAAQRERGSRAAARRSQRDEVSLRVELSIVLVLLHRRDLCAGRLAARDWRASLEQAAGVAAAVDLQPVALDLVVRRRASSRTSDCDVALGEVFDAAAVAADEVVVMRRACSRGSAACRRRAARGRRC